MSAIPGSVRVTGFVAPTDSTDTYPSHDEQYGYGGYRVVPDLSARNAITSLRRKEGMLVKVLDVGGGITKFYTLKGGIADGNWIEDLAGVVGANFALCTADDELTPDDCTATDGQDTGIAITLTPANGSQILVMLNGVKSKLAQTAGAKASSYFYFSGDGGTTARAIANVIAGDKLFFNGAVAGFGLDSSDRISLEYLVTV